MHGVQIWHNLHIVFSSDDIYTVYPNKYAHGFVVLCFVVVMQSFIMNSHEVFIHIHQGCFAGTGAIVRLPQCQWSKPDGYGKISQFITTTNHSKAKTVCIFLGMYCIYIYIYIRLHRVFLFYCRFIWCNWPFYLELLLCRWVVIWWVPGTKINTLGPIQNGWYFSDDSFKCIFLNELNSNSNFTEACSLGSN